jgi:hypothetical protein
VAKSISSFDNVYNIDGNTFVASQQMQQESILTKSDDRKMSPLEQKNYMNRNTNIIDSESIYTKSSNINIGLDKKEDNLLAPIALSIQQLAESYVDQLKVAGGRRIDNTTNVIAEPTTARLDAPETTANYVSTSDAKSDQETFDLLLQFFQKG